MGFQDSLNGFFGYFGVEPPPPNLCFKSEKTAKLENKHVLFEYHQHPQLKLANKFGNLNSTIYFYFLRSSAAL